MVSLVAALALAVAVDVPCPVCVHTSSGVGVDAGPPAPMPGGVRLGADVIASTDAGLLRLDGEAALPVAGAFASARLVLPVLSTAGRAGGLSGGRAALVLHGTLPARLPGDVVVSGRAELGVASPTAKGDTLSLLRRASFSPDALAVVRATSPAGPAVTLSLESAFDGNALALEAGWALPLGLHAAAGAALALPGIAGGARAQLRPFVDLSVRPPALEGLRVGVGAGVDVLDRPQAIALFTVAVDFPVARGGPSLGRHLGASRVERIVPRALGYPPLSALADGAPTILEVSAEWCGPCHVADARLQAFLDAHPGVRLRRILDEDDPDAAGRYGVKVFPTCIVLRGDAEPRRVEGCPWDGLDAALRR